MAVSSQQLQFLDLSGVGEKECQQLLALFNGVNPAVELLAPEPPPQDNRNNWSSLDPLSASSHPSSPSLHSPSPTPPPSDEVSEVENEASDIEVPDDVQDANQTIFYPGEGEYGEDASEPDPTPVVPPNEVPDMAPPAEVLVPESPEVQYPPQAPSAGPMPPTPPVFSPRATVNPHHPQNMYTYPPPGHPQPVYQQAPPPSHIQPPGPTVYVANCHVSVGYGGNQGGGIMGTPHQGPPHPQSYAPYIHMGEQQPPQQHIPLKGDSPGKSEYDPHYRNYNHRGGRESRGGRGGVRGRGRPRRRDDHERSNSVSSDHSNYSDGGTKHYNKDIQNIQPGHYPGHMAAHMPYSVHYTMGMQGQYMVPQNSLGARASQGPHLMYHNPPPTQFMPAQYHPNHAQTPQMLAYPPHHPSMQHMQEPPLIPHQQMAYPQGSMISPHHPGGVYMGHSAPDNIVVSLPHDPHMVSSEDGINQSVPPIVDQSIDINGANTIPINAQMLPTHDTTPIVMQPQPVYVEPPVPDLILNSSLTNHIINTKPELTTSTTPVQSIETDMSNHVSNPAVVSVSVTQASQLSVSEVNVAVHPTENLVIPDVANECNKIIYKAPVLINTVTTVSDSTDVEVSTCTVERPAPIEIIKKSSTSVSSLTRTSVGEVGLPNINTLIVDMSTKLQISTLPSCKGYQQQDIGEICFMEDADSLIGSMESLQSDESTNTKSPVNMFPHPTPKTEIAPVSFVPKPKSIISPVSFTQRTKTVVSPVSFTTQHPKTTNPVISDPTPIVEVSSQRPLAASPDDHRSDKESISPDPDTMTYKTNGTKEEVPEVAPSPPVGAWAKKKSWSKLFKPNEDHSGKRVAYVSPFIADLSKNRDDSTSSMDYITNSNLPDHPIADADVDKAKIGVMLKSYNQNYHVIPLQPRGLINKGYWCYVNAPLQALLACAPFYNLSHTIPNVAGLKKGKSSTPVLDSMVEFVNEFSNMTNMLKMNRKEKSSAQALRKDPDVVPGPAFEPSYVYKMLADFSGDQFKEGRQQDAEEMLSCVLNGLHDEMVSSLKLAGVGMTNNSDESMNGSLNGDGLGHSQSDFEEEMTETDPDEWQVIGPRRKSCVTRTAHYAPSPISQIFWGQLRSVQQQGGNITANLQPFTTLLLDIQNMKVESVRDALEQLINKEEVPYMNSETKEELTVSKQVLLEHLPPVLILQLKRFIYKDGGLQKVTKRISFSIDLEITKELMSPICRNKFTNNQRKYKLLAVISHDGKEASKGHYVADIYHSGYNCWLHYDDSVVKPISESVVLKHAPPRVPYLLFYRRVDTMSPTPAKLKT